MTLELDYFLSLPEVPNKSAYDYVREGKEVPPEVHKRSVRNGKSLVPPPVHDEEPAEPLFPELRRKNNPW